MDRDLPHNLIMSLNAASFAYLQGHYNMSYSYLHPKTAPERQSRRPFPVKVHNIHDEVQPKRKKRHGHHRKDAFNNFYKERPIENRVQYSKQLDGFLLLDTCKVKSPYEAVRAKLSGEGIGEVVEEDLKYFKNLVSLDLSDNSIKLHELYNLEALVDLNLMCNRLNAILDIPTGTFEYMEVLNLSFNRVQAAHISHLQVLGRLTSLDLSYNDLYTLPDDMSGFRNLKTLLLSGNSFSTDSVMFSASQVFKALSTIPNLTKLDLSRNKLRGIHHEMMEENSMEMLEELDFSFNWVDDQQNLLYASRFQSLQILIVTGNPFALIKQTQELEEVIRQEVGGVVVNELQWPKKKPEKLPYPRPVAMITHDFTSAIKSQLFGVEINKDMEPLPIADYNSTQELEEDVFPIEQGRSYKDIYTPSNDRGSSRPNRAVFLTESDMPEGSKPRTAKLAPQTRLDEFRRLAQQLLGDDKQYEKQYDIQSAYRQLRHALKHPRTYQSRHNLPRYAQPTASRNSYKLQVRPRYDQRSIPQKQLPMQQVANEIDKISEQLQQYQYPRIQSV